jgi:hypothetical protein
VVLDVKGAPQAKTFENFEYKFQKLAVFLLSPSQAKS